MSTVSGVEGRLSEQMEGRRGEEEKERKRRMEKKENSVACHISSLSQTLVLRFLLSICSLCEDVLLSLL